MGAKKYAYEDGDGGLHITIAGVPKKAGAAELARKGGLEAFTRGFEFTETGKLEAVYNDGSIKHVELDGHAIDITKNVCLRPTTYKLDITEEKVRLSQHLEYFKQCMDKEINQGKKLGFISQEIGREINTLGSKANNANIQTIVVKMKDELEKIKEQLANIL